MLELGTRGSIARNAPIGARSGDQRLASHTDHSRITAPSAFRSLQVRRRRLRSLQMQFSTNAVYRRWPDVQLGLRHLVGGNGAAASRRPMTSNIR